MEAAYCEGWAFYEQAYDINGNRLETSKIAREVEHGGTTRESLAITVTRTYLDNSLKTGLQLRVDGKRARKEFHAPGFYVEGFLMKVDTYLQSLPPP